MPTHYYCAHPVHKYPHNQAPYNSHDMPVLEHESQMLNNSNPVPYKCRILVHLPVALMAPAAPLALVVAVLAPPAVALPVQEVLVPVLRPLAHLLVSLHPPPGIHV